jgi:hypothetical protein
MKSAYELAMERLSKSAPARKLTDDQKKQLAELDSIYKAKTAERELALQAEVRSAEAKGESDAAEQVRRTLTAERQKLQAELEAKKDRIRAQR